VPSPRVSSFNWEEFRDMKGGGGNSKWRRYLIDKGRNSGKGSF